MLKLNDDALAILAGFKKRPLTPLAQRNWESIESAYGRLLQVFLHVNQGALNLLPRANLDDLDLVVRLIYESHLWAGIAISLPSDAGYDSVEWLLISDKKDGFVTKAFELVSTRLIKYCPANKRLEDALSRLIGAHNHACNVMLVSSGIIAFASSRKQDFRTRKIGKGFVLEPIESIDPKDTSPMDVGKIRRITAQKASWSS